MSFLEASKSNFQITRDNILEKMFSSCHGLEIRKLFDGDISKYDGDDSRADLALASYLE